MSARTVLNLFCYKTYFLKVCSRPGDPYNAGHDIDYMEDDYDAINDWI